jgi:hypothetical protein
MDDTTLCPICNSKMRTLHQNNKLCYPLNKIYSYIERSCTYGKNHYIQLFSSKETGKVDFIKFALGPRYDKRIEVDFIKSTSKLYLFENTVKIIEIPKLMETDFPNLLKLKQQIKLYCLLS